MSLRALIFDVDGTLAETEEAHRTAFNRAFAEAGLGWHWSVELYRDLLRVTGGQQRIRHFLDRGGGDATPAEIAALHTRKNALYAEQVAGGAIVLRPGVARLIGAARTVGLRLAIATTTSRSNVAALLAQLFPADAADWFDAIVVGEDVAIKKPDPEAYALALAALDLPATDVVAIEDSRNGLLAAMACGIATVVTRSFYCGSDDFTGAALVVADCDDPAPITPAVLAALVERVA